MSPLSSTFLPSPAAADSASAVLRTIPRVLAIAGSDPSGGAGIQADLKSIAANGGYAMAVVTALTAQNTQGVRAVHVPPASFLAEQLEAISDDIVVDAVKIGMLGDADVIGVVRAWLTKVRPGVVVLDPVMVATSGDRLLQESAETALRALLPLADLLTPNLPELAMLLQEPLAKDWKAALEQGKRLAAVTGATVLVKGGHLDGGECPDALVSVSAGFQAKVVVVPGERVPTRNSHGTGCSLSSALATSQARLGNWEEALREVKPWLRGALEGSDILEVGRGAGPVHHFHQFPAMPVTEPKGQTEVQSGRVFMEELRESADHHLASIYRLEFIRGLVEGSLPEQQFAYYLSQDAIYLNGYSRVLSRASAMAPTEEEQLFWARSAQQCLEVESELHRNWLSTRPVQSELGPVTKSYVDHLLASSLAGSYGVLVAAALPCFWLYAEVGATLHLEFQANGAPAEHAYADWLRTYADEDFAAATRQAIGFTERAALAGSEAERRAMAVAFGQSSRYEVEFFDAPRLHA
ncbi:bifunctional hydroxymethylpyrimidine kinase/phosphomethylpyrimidine kinase [Arthrobacter sp. R1-13]